MASTRTFLPSLLLSFGIVLSASAPVWAKDISITVPSGRASSVGGMVLYNSFDCSYLGRPVVTYPKQPDHGSVSVAWTQGKMSKTDNLDKCTGKTVKGMSFVYRPAAGFHGTDTFTIGLRSAYHGTNSYYHAVTYIITVK